MKNRIVLAFVILIALSAMAGWDFIFRGAANPKNRIAIIEDVNGDRIGVEPTSNEVWNRLFELYYSKDEMID